MERPEGELSLVGREVRLEGDGLAAVSPLTVDLACSVSPEAIRVTRGQIDSPEVKATVQGEWTDPGFEGWLVGDGGPLGGELALSARLDMERLDWLSGRFGVRRATGSVQGAIDVQGPLLDPAVTGELVLSDVGLRLEESVPTVERMRSATKNGP